MENFVKNKENSEEGQTAWTVAAGPRGPPRGSPRACLLPPLVLPSAGRASPPGFPRSSLLGVHSVVSPKHLPLTWTVPVLCPSQKLLLPGPGPQICGPAQQCLSPVVCRSPVPQLLPKRLHSCAASMVFQGPWTLFIFFVIFAF